MASSSSSRDVAFVLVPGPFTVPSVWRRVSAILRGKGHTVQECPLLSVVSAPGEREPPAKLADDAHYIREVVLALLEQDKNVVVAMHSYASFPASEAVKGLSAPERDSAAAVIGMVHLSSFLAAQDVSLRSLMGELLFEPLKTGVPGGYIAMPAAAAPGIFADLPADQQLPWFEETVKLHSSDTFDGRTTYEAYKHVPNTYLKCEADLVIAPSLQQDMIDKANEAGGKIRTVPAPGVGHMAHVSHPELVAKVLEEAAGLSG